jgi:hypothetical protein
VEYTLKRSARARAMRLAIYPDGAVVLTAPHRYSESAIARFFAQHAGWVSEKVADTAGAHVVRLRRGDIPALKRHAREIAEAGCTRFAADYGVAHGAIAIRAQKSRWGSCSTRGNVSFNYKIAALPARLAEYIIVHEVCHLREMNHSARFWAEVARVVPDYRERREELRRVRFLFD